MIIWFIYINCRNDTIKKKKGKNLNLVNHLETFTIDFGMFYLGHKLHTFHPLYQLVFNQRNWTSKMTYWRMFHRELAYIVVETIKQIQILKSRPLGRKNHKRTGTSQDGWSCWPQ